MEMPPAEDVEARSTPLNEAGNVANSGISFKNNADCPYGGITRAAVSPVEVPARVVNSKFTVAGAFARLTIARPLCTPPSPDSTYIRNAEPEWMAGTPASDTVMPFFLKEKMAKASGSKLLVTIRTQPV